MTTLTITLDDTTEVWLRKISAAQSVEMDRIALRLLRRARLASSPRPAYNIEALKEKYAEFADEDLALSEATVAEHAALLAEADEQ
jgi:hypothetical protein